MSERDPRTNPAVGVTFTRARIGNPRRGDVVPVEIELLVDTGAIFSVVPEGTLEGLAIPRLERQEFTLADGSHVAYDVGEATFCVGTRSRTSQVVFGPDGVTPLLGALTLESLGNVPLSAERSRAAARLTGVYATSFFVSSVRRSSAAISFGRSL